MKVSKRLRRHGAAITVVAAVTAAAAACSSAVAPSIAQYGVVTGKGLFSNQQVKQVVEPGQNISVPGGDTIWYLPADVRNYVTAPSNGDRNNPSAELTGDGPGNTPGMADYTWSYLAFELNPAITDKNLKMISSFMPFCLKYGCASLTAQVNNQVQNAARSSTPGWLAMLGEIMPRAIDNATRDAMASYGPDLWTDQGEWASYGDKIASFLPREIAKLDGSSAPYFCGPGSTASKCAPFTFVVSSVRPVDTSIINAYNQEVTAGYQQQAAAARLKAAQGVYGPDANFFLGMQDLVNTCQSDKVPCYFYVGNPPSHP
jgi:hypothetical protein